MTTVSLDRIAQIIKANQLKSLRARATNCEETEHHSGWDDASREIAGVIAAIDGIDGDQFMRDSEYQIASVYVSGFVFDGNKFVQDELNPQAYGIYVRDKDGHSDHIEDFDVHELDEAIAKGRKIAQMYQVKFESPPGRGQSSEQCNERNRRIAALDGLRKKAGVEYTMWRIARYALDDACGNSCEVDWLAVENNVIIESLLKYGQPYDEVVNALIEYSPQRGALTTQSDITRQIEMALKEYQEQVQSANSPSSPRMSI